MAEKITDLSYLKMISEEDNDFVEELVKTFIEQTPDSLKRLETELYNNNWKKAAETAHKMKPSFTFMGMENTLKMINDFEELCQNNPGSDQLLIFLKRIKEDCDLASVELSDFLNIKMN